MERLVDALARQADQIGELLLGDIEHAADAGEKLRIEERRQIACDAQVGIRDAVDFARGDELAQALVQLLQDEMVEANAGCEQAVKHLDRQAGHGAASQGLDVVAVGLALEQGALAEPASRWQTGEGDRLAAQVIIAHLQQAGDDTKPQVGGLANAADAFADFSICDLQASDNFLSLCRFQQGQPGNHIELDGSRCTCAVAQCAWLGR